jgi:gliding motility-associated transport system permease protein
MSSTLPESPVETKGAAPWQAPAESAPSQVRAAEPTLARWFGFVGLVLTSFGLAMLIIYTKGQTGALIAFFAPVFTVFGVAGLLFHAANDGDLQWRRTYGGYGLLILAVIVSLAPIKGPSGSMFLPYGMPSLTLGLLFLLPFIRHETEKKWRQTALLVLGGLGFLMAVAGVIGGNINENFLVPYGLTLSILAFFFLWAFALSQGTETDLGYRGALAIGLLGAIVFLAALGRSALPSLFYQWHWIASRPLPYFLPSGLLLMGIGLAYLALAIALTSDSVLVTLIRRELGAIFYSPIAYFVLFGVLLLSFWMFYNFLNTLLPSIREVMSGAPTVRPEPIIQFYFFNWWMVITLILVVPVLTMRLLSEEKRTGTLEVLLTAPVTETRVVLSKFLATFIFFQAAMGLLILYLVALRIEGGQPFDYRPVLTFLIAMAFEGAAFIAMGLFFSSLTRNQIASALLTAVGMLGLTAIFFIEQKVERDSAGSIWVTALSQMSYIHLWQTSTEGLLVAPMLIFHLSAAIFWLFLSVKVLEARQWV